MLQVSARLYSLLVIMVMSLGHVSAESLKNHPSPYLQLHANDPVNWQTWGSDVLIQARNDNKLIYLSIGYFSCHWCHVMQKESYSDPEIGAFLNKNFIPIKVDRELRPELDRRMMRFVESVVGTAGWPLNVFLTPQGYPVTGFTYLPKDNFLKALKQLESQWQQRHTEIAPVAREYFEQSEFAESRDTLVSLPDEHFDKLVDAFIAQAMGIADELQGGFGDASKFPSYPQLKALLDMVRIKPNLDPDIASFLRLTLDNMAGLNLMDQVNFGFFRYSTDPDWQTPHYEKMLYDNAQFVQLYLTAEEIWPGQGYAEIAQHTIDFMNRSLWLTTGAYASSLSAVDTENIEGGAYFWTMQQLENLLTQNEFQQLKQSGLIKENQLRFQIPALINSNIDATIQQSILDKLRQAKTTVMPVDEKKLASWNALALAALLRAELHQPGTPIRSRIQQLYRYIRQHFIVDGRVVRFAEQASSAETTLEDYAHIVYALALYAQQKNDQEAAEISALLAARAFTDFYQKERWIQHVNSLIPADKGDYLLQDAVLESPVSVLLKGIFLLPDKYDGLHKKAATLIDRMTRDMLDVPYHYASAIMLRKKYLHSKSLDSVIEKNRSGK